MSGCKLKARTGEVLSSAGLPLHITPPFVGKFPHVWNGHFSTRQDDRFHPIYIQKICSHAPLHIPRGKVFTCQASLFSSLSWNVKFPRISDRNILWRAGREGCLYSARILTNVYIYIFQDFHLVWIYNNLKMSYIRNIFLQTIIFEVQILFIWFLINRFPLKSTHLK